MFLIRSFLIVLLLGSAVQPALAAGPQCLALMKASRIRQDSRTLARAAFADLDAKIPGESTHDVAGGRASRTDRTTGRTLGIMTYRYLSGGGRSVLDVEVIEVEYYAMKSGVSRLLLASVIKDLPELTEIRSSKLAFTNAAVFKASREAGMDPVSALKSTPAYRARRRLGFSKINFDESSFADGNPPQITLVVEPDEGPTGKTFVDVEDARLAGSLITTRCSEFV